MRPHYLRQLSKRRKTTISEKGIEHGLNPRKKDRPPLCASTLPWSPIFRSDFKALGILIMTKNLLVELGLEELPAYVVTPSEKQLGEKMASFLADNRLSYDNIQTFSTPRRLAVRVTGLADAQTDLTEDFKGPSKKIALDADGNFSKAAQGFVRGKGLTVEDIEFREIKGEEYVYVTKHEAGKAAKEVLAGIPEVLASLTFPVSMHWAGNDFEYIRPVHTLTVLLDDEALDLDFLDISSGRVSRGHRFLGQEVEIASADSYEDDLRSVFVITDAKERQNMIVEQIKAIEAAQNVQVEIDADLLNEVLNLVEYPTAFMGAFDTKYLEVPEEVLVTSMKAHQRYFVVRDQAGKLMPNFISVRNGNAEHIDNVVKGNEKVLVARLEDGEFFWKEDQKLQIVDLVAKLAKVTFHEKIGSLAEHMDRAQVIAAYLAEKADLTAEETADLDRAAQIYKFDLLTGMVGEFDELQGIMGEKYALLAGENAAVAAAIREHYLPNSAEGDLPETKVGAALALADKLDTLLAFFSVGLIPSGSNDPYALRRATQGIVRILDAFGWNIPMDELINNLYGLSFDSLTYANKEEVLSFIRARVDKMMGKTPKDIKEAVLAGSTFVVPEMLAAAESLVAASKADNYKAAVESLSRVFNLAEKADATSQVDSSLFENDAEKALAQATDELVLSGTANDKVAQLFALSPVINNFFDNTMVMVEDEAVKNNRLALLASLVAKAKAVAVFNKLNSK
ncbi:glycyl-tRNA synthetase beta chain [Streptococcus henryi]|uniref:Glycine--tRNA ligase beta subunit n=2 Tax=Streptococcus henryi TaxID=439219 RepID=A0A1G6AR69_9STRE|nr:glycyl-tRNA synthetase beta chain [Streptococcus henryi]